MLCVKLKKKKNWIFLVLTDSPTAADDSSSGDESTDDEDERGDSYLDNANNTNIQDQQVRFKLSCNFYCEMTVSGCNILGAFL